MNPKVEAFFSAAEKWQQESRKLRAFIRGSGLNEELKWGKPCYTLGESNLLIIQGFKGYCALMFCKGALLADAKGLLKKPGENTQGARQLRFTSVREIAALEPTIKAYIHEAMAAEKAGLKVEYKTSPEPIPEEFQSKLRETPALRTAFYSLTPGRQRGYILYFSAAKQSKTRDSRVEKCRQRILNGKGLDD